MSIEGLPFSLCRLQAVCSGVRPPKPRTDHQRGPHCVGQHRVDIGRSPHRHQLPADRRAASHLPLPSPQCQLCVETIDPNLSCAGPRRRLQAVPFWRLGEAVEGSGGREEGHHARHGLHEVDTADANSGAHWRGRVDCCTCSKVTILTTYVFER